MIENVDTMLHSLNQNKSDVYNEDHLTIDESSIESSLNEFKKDEFNQILLKSKKIVNILSSLEEKKDYIYEHIQKYDPKAIHLANQHLTVIQTNLKEQLGELKSLIVHLEKNDIVYLEENNSYLKLHQDQTHFNRVFRIFLPYILICSIYLKVHELQKTNQS